MAYLSKNLVYSAFDRELLAIYLGKDNVVSHTLSRIETNSICHIQLIFDKLLDEQTNDREMKVFRKKLSSFEIKEFYLLYRYD